MRLMTTKTMCNIEEYLIFGRHCPGFHPQSFLWWKLSFTCLVLKILRIISQIFQITSIYIKIADSEPGECMHLIYLLMSVPWLVVQPLSQPSLPPGCYYSVTRQQLTQATSTTHGSPTIAHQLLSWSTRSPNHAHITLVPQGNINLAIVQTCTQIKISLLRATTMSYHPVFSLVNMLC